MVNLVWVAYRPNSQSQATKKIQVATNDTENEEQQGHFRITNSSNKIKWDILKEFDLNSNYSIRLRNSKGRLVPVDNGLRPNSKESPYMLEVYVPKVGEEVEPSPSLDQIDLDAKMVH